MGCYGQFKKYPDIEALKSLPSINDTVAHRTHFFTSIPAIPEIPAWIAKREFCVQEVVLSGTGN